MQLDCDAKNRQLYLYFTHFKYEHLCFFKLRGKDYVLRSVFHR